VQTEDYAGREMLFTDDYAYFSSVSSSWLSHAEKYVGDMVGRLNLSSDCMVVEVAANDGYLLQYVQQRDIPCYGIEPTLNTSEIARAKGITVVNKFFGGELANDLVRQGKSADLIIANNVLAHVPDINDFVAGFSRLLKLKGVATFEFPHLYRMVKNVQFDTVYHEHYSYLSLSTVRRIFKKYGLEVFDVEELETHGGSLRVFAQRSDSQCQQVTENVARVLEVENSAGMEGVSFYRNFQRAAEKSKNDFLTFLLQAKRDGKEVVAYGAAAKGNTILNFSGVKSDLLKFVCDAAPSKIGRYLPGSRIAILSPDAMEKYKPDYVLIFPWNIEDEIKADHGYISKWGGSFYVVIPTMRLLV